MNSRVRNVSDSRPLPQTFGTCGTTAGLGAVGGYKDLARYTTLGGTLFVFALPAGSASSS